MANKSEMDRSRLSITCDGEKVKWSGFSDRELTTDEAIAVGINRLADAHFAIASSLCELAAAVDSLAHKN